ncbi:hypothetical protein ZWY2020_001386 [Hordeum vulgare]|nr:hypothetical protein ZWY2020_001386 [Hordeum vulgare]
MGAAAVTGGVNLAINSSCVTGADLCFLRPGNLKMDKKLAITVFSFPPDKDNVGTTTYQTGGEADGGEPIRGRGGVQDHGAVRGRGQRQLQHQGDARVPPGILHSPQFVATPEWGSGFMLPKPGPAPTMPRKTPQRWPMQPRTKEEVSIITTFKNSINQLGTLSNMSIYYHNTDE